MLIINLRLNELIQGEGFAIIDAGLHFGGGLLYKYGINSNTSGGGFLKSTYKKGAKDKDGKKKIATATSNAKPSK